MLKADSITCSFTAIYSKAWSFNENRLWITLSEAASAIFVADFEHVLVYWDILRNNKLENSKK